MKHQHTLQRAGSFSTTQRAPASLLQRACACGGTPGVDGECAACRAKQLQREAAGGAAPNTAPPIVGEVLRGQGQPLEPGTRALMEPRFGHDFSRVRIHTDARAAESAQAVGARAYTVGSHIVFGPGQYAAQTRSGQQLLAHELAHTVQQGMSAPALAGDLDIGRPATPHEQEAERASAAVLRGEEHSPQLRQPALIARDIPAPDNLDPERRAEAERYLYERALRRSGYTEPEPDPGRATFRGGRLTVTKGDNTTSCDAITSATAPTPPGTYCVRRQGEAQRWGGLMGTFGRIGGFFGTVRQDRSRWYLLEPQFTTTRSKMQIHYGRRSEGCITVTDSDCFNRLEQVLNRTGTTSRNGYDGYPPGNAEGVTNEQHAVDCVAILEVS